MGRAELYFTERYINLCTKEFYEIDPAQTILKNLSNLCPSVREERIKPLYQIDAKLTFFPTFPGFRFERGGQQRKVRPKTNRLLRCPQNTGKRFNLFL
jgi:hypothetical protein